jgi:hypothetical protein
MGIKISALPEQTTELTNDFDFPVVDNTGPETKRVGFDVLYSSINVIPFAVFNNGGDDITLGNWGFWDASDDCGELFTVNLPNPGDYAGKLLILRNRTNLSIPISSIVEADGASTTILYPTRVYICLSNNSDWIVIAYYAV